MRKLAKQVAEQSDLPEDWLNDAVKGYFVGISDGDILLEMPGLMVRAPAVEQALAMKLSAWRQDIDIDDALCLLKQMKVVGHGQLEIW